ncbi:MAG: GNAT family acetyltransferase [Pseudomonadota bacterium]|nr:GNAT family acetyltransferase [Pseudomonadota bacterium]MEC8261707.1 GNAT family acetyltransferase [Pseudomonadota bacterium]
MTDSAMIFRDFSSADTAGVVALWQECGLTRPWNDPVKDIRRKQTDKNGAFWVVCRGDEVIASVMIGYDGHRGTINYLAIAPAFQRSGLGAELMRRAEAFLIEIGCPKVSFCVRKDNLSVLAFYDRLGYAADDVHFLGKRLIPDD